MFLPLPDLDDRRWADLVEDARAVIPLYAPEWTDHNASDPGITVVELLAWIAEMQVFQIDQVPAAHRLKFLSLAGIAPAPAVPARAVVRFTLPPGAAAAELPATVECETGTGAPTIRYKTRHALRAGPANLAELRSDTATGRRDLTDSWRRGEPLAVLGDDPRPGDALVLGFDAALEPGSAVTVALQCEPPAPAAAGEHHSARLAWELLVERERWLALDPTRGELHDETCALTADGRLVVTPPRAMHAVPTPGGDRFLLRARLAAGEFDAPPVLREIAVNGAFADQQVPAGSVTWAVAAHAVVLHAPQPGRREQLSLRRSRDGTILRIAVGDAAPSLFVLAFTPPTGAAPGSLTVEASRLPSSEGAPRHTVALAGGAVVADTLDVWSLEGTWQATVWRRWRLRPDLDASGPADADVAFEPATGTLRFGDGERGLVPDGDAALVALYDVTVAEAGAVPARAIAGVADSAHNQALLPGAAPSVTNAAPAVGGAAAESLEHAEGRALEAAEATTRAVTPEDLERLARATPGVRLARVAVLPNTHPGLPCIDAVGVTTVVIVPFLPARRPVPSAGARRAVAAQLERHRLIGTRLLVAGPSYVEVAVRARVLRTPLADPAALRGRIGAALDAFLDPLAGGPAGAGWPFGRDVARSEVLQVIDRVDGVEHVEDLELVGPDGAGCGDVCLRALELVVPGAHEIEVVS